MADAAGPGGQGLSTGGQVFDLSRSAAGHDPNGDSHTSQAGREWCLLGELPGIVWLIGQTGLRYWLIGQTGLAAGRKVARPRSQIG
jgi:hypothetical protein